MEEYTDIKQLLAEIKKLRAEKAAAVESTEGSTKRKCANGDSESSEIDETETWVEEPWDISNLVDSIPKVNAIDAKENSPFPETTEIESKTLDLDIPANEHAGIEGKSTSVETVGAADGNPTDLPDIEDKSTSVETNGVADGNPTDQPLGCKIYNIPEGTTFMELVMLFVGSNVVTINLPSKDSPLGHVTFADRASFLSILERTDLIIGESTLNFEADCIIDGENISTEPPENALSESIPQCEDPIKTILSDNEAEIAVEALEASVSTNIEAVKSKLDVNELKTALEPVVPTLLSVAKQSPINDSEVPYYPPFICYAYNVPVKQQSIDQLAIVFEAFNIQKILLPLQGQNCFSIEFKTRNDLLKVCKKSDAMLRSTVIEISLSATVSPKPIDCVNPPATGTHTINEADIPHQAPFICYIYDIPPTLTSEDISELLGGLVVLSEELFRKATGSYARVQLGKREDMLKLIKRWVGVHKSKTDT